ncbi:MAG: hypothetical protein AAF330_05710, partial [Pseudomonadota bacterium]
MRKCALMMAVTLGLASAAEANEWAVALPQSLPGGKDQIEQPLWTAFTEMIRPGDRYRVLDGAEPGRIAVIDLPDDPKMDRKTRRAQKFRAENARIYAHLKAMREGPAAIDLTGLLRREAANRQGGAAELALLVIGDPAQMMPDATSFSMRDADGTLRIPSDRHLALRLSITPWGMGIEGAKGLQGVSLHICPLGQTARLSAAEDAALRRFWALYVASRSGVLATWEPDLETCFERFASRVTSPVADVAPNPHDRDLVMRKVGQPVIETVTG